MTQKKIKALKEQGLSDDAIYERIAGHLGYYGIAFFGHSFACARRTRRAKRTLESIWKRIINTNI